MNIYEWILLIKKRLEDEIKSETSGHFQDGVNILVICLIILIYFLNLKQKRFWDF